MKSIKDYDLVGSDYTLTKQRQYTYTNVGNSTSSGILLKLPRYKIQYRITGRRKEHFSNEPIYLNGLMDLADESNLPSTFDKTHIEYSTVKETNMDGSYTIYSYSNYETVPDVMPTYFDDSYANPVSTYYMRIATTGSDDGINYSSSTRECVNNLLTETKSMHLYHGKLKKISHYDNSGKLVEETENVYWNENSNDPIYHEYKVRSGDLIYYKEIPIESRPIEKMVTKRSGIIKQNEYGYNKGGRLTRVTKQKSDGSQNISITRYPGDDNVAGYQELVNNNLFSFPIREETRIKKIDGNAEELISRIDYIYARTGSSNNLKYAATEIKSKTFDPPRTTEVSASEMETEMKFEYYANGKLRQSTDREGTKTTYLWGYANRYLIAIIENAAYSNVEAVLGSATINSLASNFPTDNEIKNLWTQLKNSSNLLNSQVSAATHKSHAGITMTIDPSGRKKYFEYDLQDRLISIKDEEGNIIENYSYRYRSN